MDEAGTLGLREFADHMGVKPGYVTALKQAGRLVLTDDGKRVRVGDSMRLIADTRDPSKTGVRGRHAAKRAAAAPVAGASGEAALPGADSGDDADAPIILPADPHASRRAKALADKEEALARKALREEMVELGQLLQADEVRAFVADAVTQLRVRLELLAPTLAPQLAATADEDQVRVLLRDAIELSLDDLARKFGEIAKVQA
jgi:hypothetical protein